MKTALITGGNRGIGLEICRQLDELNWQVILCSRNIDKGIIAADSLSQNVIVKQLDVTNEDSIKNLFDSVKNEIGKLDVLINNAGLGANAQEESIMFATKQNMKKYFYGVYQIVKKAKPLLKKAKLLKETVNAENISFHEVKKTMDTNFYGAWHMIQTFIPLLKNSENGKIINISSGMGALHNLTGIYPGYSLSKASLNALTVMFSNELMEKGIKVNAICPGWVKTDMGGPDAPRSVTEGADTAIWMAINDDIATGLFVRNRQIIDW